LPMPPISFAHRLAALKTYLYCAKRLPADKEMNEMLDKVDASTERMSHLSSKLLALSKAEPASAQEEYRAVNLTDVVSAAIAGLAAEATKRETELSFVPPAEPAYVRGDAHNLEELAANLIENAVFYTPAGGSVRVSLSASPRCILSCRGQWSWHP
jgi:signal transduction histidine kinase